MPLPKALWRTRMITIIIIVIAIIMFFYGIYVLVTGKVGAGDGKGGELIGVAARKIALLYLLGPIFSVFNLIAFQLFLAYKGLSSDEIVNDYESAYSIIIASTIFLFLFIIVKLSKRIYEKKNIKDDNNP
jgi:hypothetical protein